MRAFFRRLSFGLGLGCCGLLAVSQGSAQLAPSLELTQVPAFGSFSDLGGRVLNASPAAYRVAVFIYVPNAGWWSKPYCNPQLTVIAPDGSWTADITTGGSDQNATRMTALLVSTNYNEACVEGLAALPTNVLAQAVASVSVTRRDPRLRWVSFSGYDWWVKSSTGAVGPGPNYFSDSTNNLWVDALGQLHLRITNRSNQWQCAELVSDRTFGYGSYRFELASSVNAVDLNAVVGLFTWSDDPAYADREIDIECSRWTNPADRNNAQYVVQPYNQAGHLVRFAVQANQTNSTHLFTWETNRISFQSQPGSFVPNPGPGNLISNWTYTLAVPPSGDENVRLNFWLINGYAPVGNQELEFVVKSFQFVPLGAPGPAVLTNFQRLSPRQTQFNIQGQKDRRYQVLGSTNLGDWQAVATVLATNALTSFAETNSGGVDQRFYRTVTLP